jgi:hypothetical protein
MNDFNTLHKRFPFLSLGLYKDDEHHVGIVLNQTRQFIGIYLIDELRTSEEKKKFLALGESWWWESNRMLPISIFLKNDFDPFRYVLRNFAMKDFSILQGPITSLQNIAQKRIKRRTINLEAKNRRKRS